MLTSRWHLLINCFCFRDLCLSRQATTTSFLLQRQLEKIYTCLTKAKEQLARDEQDGETGNRTQNLLHLTSTMKYDAKKMSYH